MNNTLLKWVAIITITLIFLYAFSSSYASRAMDNITYVIAVGLDLAEDNENLKVTFEFTNISAFSTDSSGESASPILESATAPSVDTAINLMNVYLAKEINLSHCKVVAISEKLASRGIFTEISDIMNNPQFRPTTNIIVTKDSPEDYMKGSKSSLDKLLTKYYDIFPNSGEYTGYTANITIGEFYNYLVEKNAGNIAILGGKNTNEVGATSPSEIISGNSPITGERNTENIGLAVFKDDKYIGDLSAIETLYHCIICNQVNSFLFTVDVPSMGEKLDCRLNQDMPTKINIDISNDVPVINIDVKLSGKILTIIDNYNYSDINILNDISSAISSNLEKSITDYLNKTSTSFESDIDFFYKSAKQNFLTLDEWNNYDWKSKYKKATFNVHVESSIASSLLVSSN